MNHRPAPTLLASTILLSLALGCGGLFQTYAGGVQALCDAPDTCVDCAADSPEMAETLLARHIEATVTNSTARTMYDAVSTASSRSRIEMLEYEAKTNGIETCAMVDRWRSQREASLQQALGVLCGLHASCASFTAAEPETVIACAREADIHPDVVDEIGRMRTDSGPALATAITSYAAIYDVTDCDLTTALRSTP